MAYYTHKMLSLMVLGFFLTLASLDLNTHLSVLHWQSRAVAAAPSIVQTQGVAAGEVVAPHHP